MRFIFMFIALLAMLCGCSVTSHDYESYEDQVAREYAAVVLVDSVDKSEARAIGNHYLSEDPRAFHTGHHLATLGNIIEFEDSWAGEVLIGTLWGLRPAAGTAPVYISKTDGVVVWEQPARPDNH